MKLKKIYKIGKKDVKISVMAVLNDSTGTLMSCAHKNLNCKIGVIIGKLKNMNGNFCRKKLSQFFF